MNAFSNSIYFMVQLPCMKFSQSLHSHYLGSENSFGGCPVHWRIFSGILALYPQDVSSIQYSYDSRKCLQTLPNVPGGQNCPLVKNHCITVKWQALRRGTKLIKPWYHPRAIFKKKNKKETWFHLHPSLQWTKAIDHTQNSKFLMEIQSSNINIRCTKLTQYSRNSRILKGKLMENYSFAKYRIMFQNKQYPIIYLLIWVW